MPNEEVSNSINSQSNEIHLEEIGHNFTPREDDVTACLLSGRSAKGTAKILSIAPKTVAHYLAQVRSKVKCDSQEQVIDYFEKAENYSFFKRHYLSLLIDYYFKIELNKIYKKNSKDTYTCLILYDPIKNRKPRLVERLAENLTSLGLRILFEEQDKTQVLDQYLVSLHPQAVDYIIQCSALAPKSNLLELNNRNMDTDAINLVQVVNKNLDVYKQNDNNQTLVQELIEIGSYNLKTVNNYYFMVFDILQKLSPNLKIGDHIKRFEKQLNKFLKINFFPDEMSHNKSSIDSQSKMINKTWKDRLWTLLSKRKTQALSIAFLSLFFVGLNISTSLKKEQDTNTEGSWFLNSKKHVTAAANENFKWNLPRQDQIFIGREEYLKHLGFLLRMQSKKMSAIDGKAKNYLSCEQPLIVVSCVGLGGVGKTQLALQYVNHYSQAYRSRIWFPAESTEQLKQEYFKFAKMLGYPDEHSSFEATLLFVKNWLAKNPGWIIVYDNVNSYKEIQPFLPESGGHVILTSRTRYWPETFSVLPIEVMSERESDILLNSIIASKSEDVKANDYEAKELVKILGYLPLAIAQAGAYIHQNQITVSKYLKLYKESEAELLSANAASELTSNMSIATTWNLSLKKLVEEAMSDYDPTLSLDLIMACAYLAPENISREFLFTWFKEVNSNLKSPELLFSKIIGQLWKYSLIHVDGENSFRIHRLLQTVLRTQHDTVLKINGLQYPARTIDWFDTILKTCSSYYKLKHLEGEFRDQHFLSHLLVLEDHVKKLQFDTPRQRMSRFMNIIGVSCFSLGNMKSAIHYCQESLKIAKKNCSSIDKGNFGVACNNIGMFLDWMGDPQNATSYLEKSLELAQQYPKEHDFLEVTMSNLGQNYRHLGELQKAKELLETSSELIEKRYGKDGVWTAMNAWQLGEVYEDLGDSLRAKQAFKKALDIREKYFGKNDRKVAETLISLGEAYINSGEVKSAKAVLERALKIFEQDYGKGHILTARILTDLGSAYRELDEFRQSKKILEGALSIRKQYYKSEHPQIVETLGELGKTYAKVGDFEQAKNLLETVRKFQIGYYGENHIKVGHTLYHLSKVYTYLKETNIANELMHQSHKIFSKRYGENHFLTKETDKAHIQN